MAAKEAHYQMLRMLCVVAKLRFL